MPKEKELVKIFNNLEGKWILERIIHNMNTSEWNYVKGKACFFSETNVTNKGNVLRYNEEGFLYLTRSKKTLSFNKKYRYRCLNDTIEIFFDDGLTKGQLFQKMIPDHMQERYSLTGSEYICKLDRYNASYYFKNAQEFETYYTIVGKQKNYKINSSYRKCLYKTS